MKKILSITFITLLILTCSIISYAENKAIVQGQIINSHTNKPVKGVKVNIRNRNAFTDKKGYFELKKLSTGQNKIIIYKAEFEDKIMKIDINKSKKDLGKVKINPINSKDIKDTYIQGKIKNKKTGEPIKKARIKLNNRYTLSNEQGEFIIKDLKTSNFESIYLEITKPEFEKIAKSFDLKKGKNNYGDIYLKEIAQDKKKNKIKFNNNYLSRKIIQKIGRKDITKADLKQIKMLSLNPENKVGTFNLSILKYMTNLKSLRIQNAGKIKQFDIKNLIRLRRLEINNSTIPTLNVLPKYLEQLIITDSTLKDFNSLERLKDINLKLLTLKDGNLSKNNEAIHRAINELKGIKRLTLNKVGLTNIGFIDEVNPTYFNVAHNKITSLKPFYRLNTSKIEVLNLQDNNFHHIHQLEDLQYLKQVNLKENDIYFTPEYHWNKYAKKKLKEKGVQVILK